MASPRRRWPLWWWWPLVVLAVSAPLQGFTPKPRWDRVNLVPFADPDDKPIDVAGNIALYLPFGASFAGQRRSGARLLHAILAAGLVSLGAEATQIFSTVRDPSATDVASAMIGAGIGAWLRTRPPALDA